MIKPNLCCPYCGSNQLGTAKWHKRGTWFVRCKVCAATGPSLAKTEEEAIKLFDTRREPVQGRLDLGV